MLLFFKVIFESLSLKKGSMKEVAGFSKDLLLNKKKMKHD